MSLRASITLQETQSIHYSMNIPKIDLKYVSVKNELKMTSDYSEPL